MDEFTIVKLLKSKGKSIRQITKALKISWNTIRKYLRNSKLLTYQVQSLDKSNDILLSVCELTPI